MPRPTKYHLDIHIDKLTNSILNTISGDSFLTDINETTKGDLNKITKRNGWHFNWIAESKMRDRKVYKITIKDNPNIIRGLQA